MRESRILLLFPLWDSLDIETRERARNSPPAIVERARVFRPLDCAEKHIDRSLAYSNFAQKGAKFC